MPPLFVTFPDSASLVDLRAGSPMSVVGLWHAVEARASELSRAGIGRGDCAIVAQPQPVDYLRDIFALWSIGAMAVATNPAITPEERRNVLAATGASALLDASTPLPGGGAASPRPAPLGMDEPALALMTSGTTGRPKGIVHTQRSLAARLALNLAAIGHADLERSLCVLPLHFGHGLIGNVFTVLAAGATLLLWPRPDVAELREFAATLDREGITFMSSTPAFWNVAMRLSKRPERAMRRVHVGSAPLSLDRWRAIAEWTGTARVFNMYGMTETANWIGGACLEDRDPVDGLVGAPWGGAVAVLTGDGTVAGRGSGEVLLATPSLMSFYLGMERETEAAFHGPWFRTGDIGTIRDDGALVLTGRIKHEINRGGVKVPAEEIDLLLERHPSVQEACAFALPDPVAGECVAAAIVLREAAGTDAILAWCRERCRAEAVPLRLFVMASLPRNERGKLVRDDIRAAALAAEER